MKEFNNYGQKIILISFLIFASLLVFSTKSKAQTSKAKIILIREGMHEGSAAASSIFLNDSILCKLNNKKYSVHEVESGNYNFHAQWGGNRRGSDTRGDIQINIEDGKTYYIKFNVVAKAFNGYVGLIEVTESTYNKLKDELKLDDKCL